MSVFKVKLNNVGQGRLDIDPTTGVPFATSNQRSIYVAGPGRKYRKLRDGETFTDNNYWKQFTAEIAGYEAAFIEVVSDDGSVYSDIPEENTFAIGHTFTNLSTSFSDNVIDFVDTYGGPATFLQVTNTTGSTRSIQGEVNGDTNVIFTLADGETQVFNTGDVRITMLRLKGVGGTDGDAQVIGSVRSLSQS
jgi:hypothetical protein